jgi:segregation and condensation protein A
MDTAGMDLESATEFLVTAATLLLLKARSLLPGDEEPEEMEETEAAREQLLERLLAYRKYQEAAGWLGDAYAEHGWYSPSLKELYVEYSSLYPDPFARVSSDELGPALVELLLLKTEERVDTTFIAPIRVSVSEQVERVREVLSAEGKTTFTLLTAKCETKIELIAMFLAVLELFKRGELTFSQRRIFSEIDIKAKEGEKSVA